MSFYDFSNKKQCKNFIKNSLEDKRQKTTYKNIPLYSLHTMEENTLRMITRVTHNTRLSERMIQFGISL
jgi:hypothetical protein